MFHKFNDLELISLLKTFTERSAVDLPQIYGKLADLRLQEELTFRAVARKGGGETLS